ncbi:MAG: Bifunctional protein GlmU [Chloroflexi bacterium]|nr:Bifunctional protein GlmU [Chloroflexota bacterium]
MSQKIKIVIPMAGFGTRLRPQTWSRPKQLIRLADNNVLGHVLDMFVTLPDPKNVEFVFIIGYLGEKIKEYMAKEHPEFKVHYIVQEEMRGQSHALYLAREHLTGPMLMVFADTLIETDLSFLTDEELDIVAWVKAVPDPRRFGVAEVNEDGQVTRLIEKPKSMDNNLAVVGFYYFKEGKLLVEAIEEQIRRDIQLKSEYFLADAINIMLEDEETKMGTEKVDVWLDAGTPEAVLETNRYLLEHGHENSSQVAERSSVRVTPPIYVHPQAEVKDSMLGPHVAIGAGCRVQGCVIQNTVIEEDSQVANLILQDTLIGQNAQVTGQAVTVNLGDNTKVEI